MNVKNKLEDFAKKYLETIPKVSYEYTLLDTKHSTTIWDSEGCAFVLVSPIDDTIKEFRSQVSSGKSATFRKNISTSLAYKMSESEALFVYNMLPIVNEGIRQLQNSVGCLDTYEVIAGFPGAPKTYFRDTNTASYFEFRLTALYKGPDNV